MPQLLRFQLWTCTRKPCFSWPLRCHLKSRVSSLRLIPAGIITEHPLSARHSVGDTGRRPCLGHSLHFKGSEFFRGLTYLSGRWSPSKAFEWLRVGDARVPAPATVPTTPCSCAAFCFAYLSPACLRRYCGPWISLSACHGYSLVLVSSYSRKFRKW